MLAAYLAAWLPVAVLLGATFVYAGVAAGSNEYQIERNYDVSHQWETRERLAALGGFAVLAFLGDNVAARYGLAAVSTGLGFALAAALFGLRFDVRLNLRRGLRRDYVGTDPNTAALDKKVTLLGLTGQQYAWAKLALVLLGTAALLWVRRPR